MSRRACSIIAFHDFFKSKQINQLFTFHTNLYSTSTILLKTILANITVQTFVLCVTMSALRAKYKNIKARRIIQVHPFKLSVEPRLKGSFHEAIGPVIAVVQYFSLMPVNGILNPDVSNLHFKWCSIRSIFAISTICLGATDFVLAMCLILRSKISIENFGAIVYFCSSNISFWFIFLISMEWKAIMLYWWQQEKAFLILPYENNFKVFVRKIKLITLCFFAFGFGEHIFYCSQVLYRNYKEIQLCNSTVTDLFEYTYLKNKYYLAIIIPYHPIALIIAQWANLILTISWSFIDIFIVMISVGITIRYEQINQLLTSVQGKDMPEHFWIKIRGDYLQLNDLVRFVDQKIGSIIFLSCSNNLYFICQLLYANFIT